MKQVKLISAYTLVALFSISVVILSAIICHLSYRCKKDKQRQVRFFMTLTIAAVILFELTLLLVIAICVQVILIDGHMLHTKEHWFDHAYYDAFESMEYMVAICDTTAHLCVIFVFIVRFHHSFNNETMNRLLNINQHSASLSFRLLSVCTILLTIFGGVIVVLICIQHSVLEIIILEIIWEILVDLMCLWLLYLFLSKLYLLLQLSMHAHVMNGNSKSGFVKKLIEATKASIERSKSDKSNSKKNSHQKTTHHISMYTVTVDGHKMQPLTAVKSNSLKPFHSNTSQVSDFTEAKSTVSHHTNMELTITANAISDNEHTDNEQTDNEATEDPNVVNMKQGTNYELDLIGVMTKMTILVSFSVLVSVLGVIGNIFIEIEEIQNIEKHDVSIEELWTEILPMIDVLVTSVMLYLQFNFTQKTYRVIFGRLDIWFLTKCLQCIECIWKKRETQSSETLQPGNSSTCETNTTINSTDTATI